MDFKTKVDGILVQNGYSEVRPAKMDIDDLLKYVVSGALPSCITYCPFIRLLYSFQEAGIHFA